MLICPSGKDSADNFIVENAEKKDLVITRDILLAERLLEKGITAINDRGTLFTEEKIQYMKEERELSLQMESLGLKKGKNWNTYSQKELAAFSRCFFDRKVAYC